MDTTVADQIITNGLALFKNVSVPWLSAIGGLGVMAIWVFYKLSDAVGSIAAYYKAKDAREIAADKESQDAKIRQMTDQTRREKDNYEALLLGWDEGWISRLNAVVNQLKADDLKSVFLMVPANDSLLRNKVSTILYDSSRTIEGKASDIVQLLKEAAEHA